MARPKLSAFEQAIRMQISSNLKRLAKGMTQREISEKTNIPASTLSGYFNKTSTINQENLQTLASFFNVEPGAIDPRIGNSLPMVQHYGGTTVINEKFVDSATGLIFRYRILTLKEEIPAMLAGDAGEFEIIINMRDVSREFLLRCSYLPMDDSGQWFLVTTSKVIPSGAAPDAVTSNYDLYAEGIHSDLPADIQVSVDNAIKRYFLETLRKPVSLDIGHNI